MVWAGPECIGVFVGSPAVVRAPSTAGQGAGALLVGFDYFGASTFNDTKTVHRSLDEGKTWQHLSQIPIMYWANLFVVDETLYAMGTFGDDIHKVGSF